MCVNMPGTLALNAVNTETVGETPESVDISSKNSGIYETLAIVAGAGVILLSAILVGVYKCSHDGKR